MEPPKDIVGDYYGNKEYVGPDAYGYFHNVNTLSQNTDVVSSSLDNTYISKFDDSYGKQPPYEKDWYASNDPQYRNPMPLPNISVYMSIKRRIFWYSWKIYSNEYISYKDFKEQWDPSSSIRKEVIKDIKSVFRKK